MSGSAPSRADKIAALLRDLKINQITNHDAAEIKTARIENCIGFSKVPLGIAGPLLVTGPDVHREVFAPLATCESTVVASCSRGCKVLNASGGVHFDVLSECMVRAPVFLLDDPARAVAFRQAWPTIDAEFRAWAESTSAHARLESAAVHVLGAQAHLVCQFHCGGASGQNMVTKACDVACKKLLASDWAEQLGIRGHLVEGNMSSDKKPSWSNVIRHRGTEVQAWGTLTNAACQSVLGCSTAQLYRAHTILLHGAVRGGHFGANINTANILAAMFIAMGQDAASVAEASWSHLQGEYDDVTKDLTFSLYFPALPVATIGGGTVYATQQEALKILGCTAASQKGELAGLIACFALALDLSTLAAIANDTFTASHMQLARGGTLTTSGSKL